MRAEADDLEEGGRVEEADGVSTGADRLAWMAEHPRLVLGVVWIVMVLILVLMLGVVWWTL